MGGNVSKKLKPNKISAPAMICPAGTVLLRQRHSKIRQLNSQIKMATVVTPESGPVGL